MWGADECDKYAQARVMYIYMFTHPGKKLNFMGNELGQLYEWSEAGTLDWALAERPFHRFFHSLCKTYVENPALHADYAPDNFRWAENHADAPCVFGMERRANGETLLALCNFADSAMPRSSAAPERRLPSPARIVCVRLRCRDTVRFCSSCKIEKQPKGISFPLPYTITNC